jgi:serine/threonine protein kinase
MADYEAAPASSAAESWQLIEVYLHPFERAWQSGSRPALEKFLPSEGSISFRRRVLRELIEVDLERRRRAGEPARREEYLARYPELGTGWLSQTPTIPHGPPPPDSISLPPLTPPFVLGQYHVEAKIGQGGMGMVYRARHAHLKKLVAIKLLPPDCTDDLAAVARFQREMEAIGRLDHQHIVRATDAGKTDDVPFLVMELVEGIDLGRLIRLHGPLSLPQASALVAQAASGLQCAHEHGLVHRDIKPSNLLLSIKGELKILDLGLALLTRGAASSSVLTGVGLVMGTADYMAPEQWQASHAVDIRADIYSLGCTLYTLLIGRPPFGGPEYKSAPQKMTAHFREPVKRLRDQRPDVPESVDDLLQRMTAKDPADRPATPSEVASALAPFAAPAELAALARRGVEGACEAQFHELPLAAPEAITVQRHSTIDFSSTSPRQRQRPAFPARRVLLVAVPGLAGVVALILAAWSFILPRERTGEHGAGSRPPDHGQPVRAGNLLDRPPVPLLWPPGGNSRWELKEKGLELFVHVDGDSLLRLGETTAAAYELEATIEQILRWGEVGLFFGRHPDVYQNQPCQKYQLVHLAVRAQPGAEKFFIDHRIVYQLDGSQHSIPAGQPIPVPRPEKRGYPLKLTITGRGIFHISWGGNRLSDPRGPGGYPELGERDFVGEYGVYNSLSSSYYRNVMYHPLPEDRQ